LLYSWQWYLAWTNATLSIHAYPRKSLEVQYQVTKALQKGALHIDKIASSDLCMCSSECLQQASREVTLDRGKRLTGTPGWRVGNVEIRVC